MSQRLDVSFLRDRSAQKRIVAITAAFAIAGLLYAVLAPSWYRSFLTVVPAKSQKAGISSMLGSELGGLAAGLGASMGESADVQRIAAVLQSIAVSDAVSEKFDLRRRYEQKYQEGARAALWAHCDVKTLPKPSLVQFSCEDKDPRFAQAMVGYFAEYGNQVFRRVSVSSASEEVRFLEKHVAELRQQADDAAARMREFQEKYQIVDLDTQAKAVVGAMASLNSQRISKQLELEYARTFSSRDEATMQQLESQLAVVDEKLRDLENPSNASPPRAQKRGHRDGDANGMFPAALAVPKMRAEFEKLYRDRRVAEGTLVYALEHLEGARASEARDVSTFLVLDPPTLPTRKSRPYRLFVFVIAAALGMAAAVAFEAWRTFGGFAALVGAPPRLAAAPAPGPGDVPVRAIGDSER
jgi:capsule polysaccharide export protein KpsE/RkpR